MRRLLACLTTLLLVSTPVCTWAATYYAGEGGKNAHSCSAAQTRTTRKLHVNAAIACLQGGDTLIVTDGTYPERLSNVAIHAGVQAIPNGTASALTTIQAENKHGAVFNPVAHGGYDSVVEWMDPAPHHIRLEGLVLDGRNNTLGVGISGLTNPTEMHSMQVVDVRIQYIRDHGVQHGGQNHHYLNVDMEYIGQRPDGTSTCGVCGDPPTCTVPTPYHLCHSYYLGGSGWVIDGGTHKHIDGWVYHQGTGPGGHVFKNGTIENAWKVANCHNSTIYNVTARNLAGAVTMGRGCVLVHNTFTSHTRGAPGTFIHQNAGSPNVVKNNLLFAFAVEPVYGYIFIEDGSGNNILDSGGHPNIEGNVCDYNQNGCLFASPSSCFVQNASGGDLRLCANSPAIGAGVADADIAFATPDKAGVPRPQGAPRDVGAFVLGHTAPPISAPPPPPVLSLDPPAVHTPKTPRNAHDQ